MSEIRPVHYRLRFEPDLQRFVFAGTADIRLAAGAPTRELTLDAIGLAVWGCEVGRADAREPCAFSVDPASEALRIHLPAEMSGDIEVRISYMGPISAGMSGFYRSRYTDGDHEGVLAVTQFEESDARRAFPCLDHPLHKATFDVEMIVEAHRVCLSNTPVAEEEALADGRKRVRFETTPKMSTYLLFFGVGDFVFQEDEEDPRVRVVTPPGMLEPARPSLAYGRQALAFCETFYGVPYPLPKLDLIAVADFAFGAMENWGAITFRENLLLHFEASTSSTARQRIFEVIAHEIAHQWFGNLVSPADWTYLWLNESFATLFGYRVVDHYRPDWETWSQFLFLQTDKALDRDGLGATVPIEIPGGEHVVINEVTAPIIYNKGASVVRQVEEHIGTDCVRRALKIYLERHAYGCAASHHLWEALEEASDQPISRMMQGWIEQAGHPLVEVGRDGDRLRLHQQRFSFLPGAAGGRWMVPMTIHLLDENGAARELRLLLEEETVEVDLEGDAWAYKVNAGQTGFYRVRYEDPTNLERLGSLVAAKRLPPEDRWGVQNDLYALVRRGDVPLETYLAHLAHYAEEDAFLPLAGVAQHLFHAHLVLAEADRPRVARAGRPILEQALERIGLEPGPGEPHAASLLRDQILLPALVLGATEVLAFAAARFQGLMAGEAVHPDIQKGVMQAGAMEGGEEALAWFEERLRASPSEHERMNVLMAVGKFRDPALLGSVRAYILEHVPARNRFVPICHMATSPEALPAMWDWFTANLDRIEELHPVHFERVLAAIVPLCGLGREEEVRAFFGDYGRKTDRAREAIQLSLEILSVNERQRKGAPGGA